MALKLRNIEEDLEEPQQKTGLTLREPEKTKPNNKKEEPESGSDLKRYLSNIVELGKYAAKEAGPETWNVGKASVKGVGKALAGAAELLYPKNPMFPMFPKAFGLDIPPEKRFSVDSEKLSKKLDELIPTDPSFLSSAAERAGKNLPREVAINTVFPGAGLAATALRTAAGGVLGEGAKELGGGEFLQGIAEASPHIVGGVLKAGLKEAGRNADVIRDARSFGLNDKQTTLVLDNATKQSWFSKIASKHGTTKAIKETEDALGTVFERIARSPAAQNTLTRRQALDLKMAAQGLSVDMIDSEHIALMKEVNKFLRGSHSGTMLAKLNKRINQLTHGNIKATNLIRPHLRTAEQQISPVFAEQFGKANNLFSNLMTTKKALKPTVVDNFASWAEAKAPFAAIASYLAGYTLPAEALLLEQGVRRGSKRILTDPKLQQLGIKFKDAIVNNSFRLARVIGLDIEKEVKKHDKSLNIKAPTEQELKKQFGRESKYDK